MATAAAPAPASEGHTEPEITTEPLMLYNWMCPYVHRVTLALAHKQAHIRHIDIDLANKPDWLTKYSPLGKVPAVTYIEGGEQQVLYESLPLQQWVDEYFQGPELLPGTPAQRAKARIIISRADSGLVSAFYNLLRAPDKQAFKAEFDKTRTELAWLEQHTHPKGPFLLGDKPTIVDAAVAPWLLRAFVIKHFRNVDMLQGFPRLTAFLEAYKALPEVGATLRHPVHGDSPQKWSEGMIEAYTKYAGGPPVDYSNVATA